MNKIDVSKCQYYIEDDMCDAAGTVTLHCSKNNCYYKQLQKIKQENEELKNQIFNWEEINKIQEQKLEQLKEYYKIQIDYCKNKNDCELCILEPCESKKILQIIEGE